MTPAKTRLLRRLVPFTGILTMGLVLTQWQDSLGWWSALGVSAAAGLAAAGVFAAVFVVWENRPEKPSQDEEEPGPRYRRKR